MFSIPGSPLAVSATPLSARPTSWANAWAGPYATVMLDKDLDAIRVHVNAGSAASVRSHLARGAGEKGRWFAIGDMVLNYPDYLSSRALPQDFTHVAICKLFAGSILNLGTCAPLFGRPGGGEQAEWLAGPAPLIVTREGATWSREYGHA